MGLQDWHSRGTSMMRLSCTETKRSRLYCSVILLCFFCHAGAAWGPRTLLDDAVQTVKGSGSISASTLFKDYLKNLTAATTVPVIYVYDAVGDTQGQENFIAKTYDYVISDMPLTVAQYQSCNRPVMQIPFGVNAVGASHTIPGIPNGALRLDARTLSGIWQCNITHWNDPAIQALNPDLTLPAVNISAVARADKASATWLLTSFLNTSQVGWVLGVGKAVSWPPCVRRVKGVQELLTYLNNTQYAAGMVQHVLAENQLTPYAAIQNRAGFWILPSQANFTSIVNDMDFPSTTVSPDWIKVHLGQSEDPSAYPLSGLEFIIVNQNSKFMGFPEGALLRDLAFNMLTPGFQSVLRKYRYAEVPSKLRSLYGESNLMTVAANDNDTGLDAYGSPLPMGGAPPSSASAGTSRFKWWAGLIIALVVILALLICGSYYLVRRRRRQQLIGQGKNGAGVNGSGLPFVHHQNGLGSNNGQSGGGKGTVGTMDSAEQISGQPQLKDGTPSTHELVLLTAGSAKSGSREAASGVASRGTGTPGTGTRSTGGREGSLLGIQDLLRHRSEAGLDALELGPLIGRGSFGRVYKGRWRGGTVAVKIINHDKHVGNNFDALRESVLCSNIQHPNVVMTYKVHTIMQNQAEAMHSSVGLVNPSTTSGSGSPNVVLTMPPVGEGERDLSDQLLETWMLLEYCDQGNLEAAARESRFKNDFATIYLCLMDIASGMDYLHSLGVLHGDVKGANVLLKTTAPTAYDPRGFVCKMADFGLSRVLESDATHVSTFTYGTAAYMAPELLQKGKMTRAADVYSFAMIMVELFTCKRLFEGLAQQQIMFQVFSGQKPPLDREGMPEDYEQLIEDCWDDAPESRPTFAAILQRLRLMYSRERQRLFSIEQDNKEADAPAV
ncbi:probable LIM domain-containing serine/threonine-protein ki at C-terminar half [Coccomyxa sp. Obi]|nr:probable LIM domain-containing serine/threonine-protein ki at C-terminar half [Coccomyxa sp. Obi]